MNAETKIQKSLASAMAAAFGEIEAATKSATNPHFKSKYADLGSVIDALKPPLIKHGLFFTQRPHPCEGGVSVETVLHHSSGEELSLGTLFVPANRNDAQGFGSALTYARRYALQTAFGVPTEDDDGNEAARASANPTTGEPMPAKAAQKDAPFAQGPAKNKTTLKDLGRDFWKDVEACGDEDELVALIATNKQLVEQIKIELPAWWEGGERNGEPYEGLSHVIERNLTDFRNLANVRTPIDAG